MFSMDKKIGKSTKEINHQIDTYGSLKTFGYNDFVPIFKAENLMYLIGLTSIKKQSLISEE